MRNAWTSRSVSSRDTCLRVTLSVDASFSGHRCLVASSGSADRPQPGADQAEHRRPKLCGRAVQRPRSSQLPQSRLSGATHEGGALCAVKPAITAQRARTSMMAKRHIGSVTRARWPSFALPGTFKTNFVIDLHPPAGCRRRARRRASVSTMVTRFSFPERGCSWRRNRSIGQR